MSSKISIIIPCYNVQNIIERCINSLTHQTLGMDNIECIFVDDASTDDTLSILSNYESQYSNNVLVIHLSEHSGIGAAKNTAMEYASSPYVGFINPTDWIEPAMLEKMLITIEQYDCDFVECHWNLAQDDHHCYSVKKTLSYGYHNLKDTTSREQFIYTHIGSTAMWNKIFKKSFLMDNNIFCPENINYEDIFFCYLVYIYATSCYSIEETFYHCYYNSDSTQEKQDAKIFDKMIVAAGFLDTCRERLSNYATLKSCIEWMFLEIYYVYMLWEVFQLFPSQSYSRYMQMKTTISSIVPDYITNPFRNDDRNTFDNIMLKLLEYDLSEHDLNELRDRMLINFKHGGNVFFPDSYEGTNRFHAELSMSELDTSCNDKHSCASKGIHILFCKWNSVCEKGIHRGFQQSGYQVDTILQYIENVHQDMNYYDALIFRLSAQRYDCVFTVDFLPIVAKCCNNFHVPYVCWTIDNPVNELYSDTIRLPWNRIFYFDRNQYEQFAPRNPEHSYYMPLACDADYLESVQLSEEDHLTYDCDISFIGSTYEEKCPYNTVADKLSPYMRGFAEGIIQAQCNVYGLHFIEDTLTEELCSEFIKHTNQIANISSNSADFRSIIADSYIGRKCTVQDRLITLQNISEHYSLDLYTVSDVPQLTNINLRGSVDYETVMPKIIKCSKINLNMTSRSIRTGLPLRIFDIMGAGGFLLTNYQAELPELFEIGKELVVYESQSDLLSQINYYLKHDDIRREIAKRGQTKVQELHSYKTKLEHMINMALDI